MKKTYLLLLFLFAAELGLAACNETSSVESYYLMGAILVILIVFIILAVIDNRKLFREDQKLNDDLFKDKE